MVEYLNGILVFIIELCIDNNNEIR